MKSLVVVALSVWALVVAACTRPNPLDCADGNCTDTAHPFCDSDGSLQGAPNTCIAVTCTPNMFAECRGTEEIRCDGTGTNYVLTACEHECNPSFGCLACTDNSECTPAEPTCDTQTHTCRACMADADCTSNICDVASGTCHDESKVIYASPDGLPTAPCGDMAHPCTMEEAFSLVDATKDAIKLAPANYTSFGALTKGATVTVFGAGATLHASGAPVLDVSGGANLIVRGLEVQFDTDTPSAITCTTDSSATSKMDLDGVTISRNHATTAGIDIEGCDALVTNAHLVGITNGISAIKSSVAMAHVTVDRSVFDGASVGAGPVQGDGSSLILKNSLVLRATLFGNAQVGYSTLVESTVNCSMFGSPTISDSVAFRTSGDTFTGQLTSCTAHYDIVTPQSTSPGGDHLMLNVDPKFADPANGDYHLTAGSPAVDAADPAAQDAYDLDGVTRPQGAANDLGAYELH